MGKRQRRSGGRGRGKGKRAGWDAGGRGGERSSGWAPEADTTVFENYYRQQNICPEEEWPEMLKYLKKQLPLTFRINGSGRFAENLVKKLSDDTFLSKFSSEELMVEGELVSPPKPLAWYPNKLAWQFDFSRTHLRKIPEMKEIHEFIKAQTEVGAITRQEAVSMVPPLFLDCKPGHRILDMCAAPGSKTFQMLELLHNSSDASESSGGLVVGNDADSQRCATLTHQAQRMRSPSLLVTNHEAQNFPSIVDHDRTSDDAQYMWDRILCDVPCSGDGTLRKAPGIWSRWSQGDGNGLHLLQLKIAMRAAELLKVGGRMVYSTCTFNPIEDEAVVAELLRRTHGGLKLIDGSGTANGLQYLPGLLTWKVMDGEGEWHESWETGQRKRKLYKSMFPGDDEDALGLGKTMRFLPHHQNTGGFYVAVLEKIKEMPPLVYPVAKKKSGREHRDAQQQTPVEMDIPEGEKVTEEILCEENQGPTEPIEPTEPTEPAAAPSGEVGDQEAGGYTISKAKQPVDKESKVMPEWGPRGVVEGTQEPKWKGNDPIVPYKNMEVLATISDFYGIPPESPLMANLICRSAEPLPRKLVYLGDGPKMLLQMDDTNKLRIVNTGVKVFERTDSKVAQSLVSCRYRLSQEGTHVVFPYMKKQLVTLRADDFAMLLRERVVIHTLTSSKDGTAAPVAEQEAGEQEAGEQQAGEQQAGEQQADTAPETSRAVFNNSETCTAISALNAGCCVALLADEDLQTLGLIDRDSKSGISGSLRSEQPFLLPCWKGRTNISVMMSKLDCDQMLDCLESTKTA